MIISLSEIDKCFEKIQKKSIIGSVTVVILVGPDVDSICASLILMRILKSENILYRIFPVSGFIELDKLIDDLKNFQNLKSMIFLNAGAIIDLTEKWFAAEEKKITIYVFDNHRPIHHNNVNSAKKIILIDDQYCNIEDCPTKEDMDIGEEGDEDEDNLDEDYLQFEEEKDINMDELPNENEEEEVEIGKKRKTQHILDKKLKKKLRLERREKIKSYYSGHYYGRSTSCLMFYLAQQLNKDSNEFIWWSILGLTDLLIHEKITFNQYQEMVPDLHNYVLKLNALDYEKDNNGFSSNNEDLFPVETENKAVGKIFIENEFMMMRHWTLYDSMFYSNYLAPRLAIWSESGKKELHRFIALMGIPLDEAKQKYKYMSTQLKNKLKDMVCQVGLENFDLDDILFNSFIKQIDSKLQISAPDMVHCLNAVLVFPKLLQTELMVGLFDQEDKKKKKEEENKENNLDDAEGNDKNKNFWWAYDILRNENTSRILQGIEMAIDFQKALINEAIFLIEKKSIIPCSGFRHTLINSETLIEKKYFLNPLALQKLALFLMEIFKIQKNEANAKPMVVSLQNKLKNTYLIVGVVGSSATIKNTFGTRFINAAEKTHTKIKHDDFETSIVEINKEDFSVFFDELTENK